jgi:hypothetical protein
MNSGTKDNSTRIKKISRRKERVKEEHKGWEEFFTIYSGKAAKIHFGKKSPHRIGTVGEDDAVVTFDEVDSLSHILHDAYQLKDATLLTDLQTIPEFNDVIGLPCVPENYEILRNAQVDWKATNWFSKDIFGVHANEIRRELMRKKAEQPCPAGVANVVYDVNHPVQLEFIAETAIRICYDDIVKSRESDDKLEPLKVAVEIGKIMQDLLDAMPLSQQKLHNDDDEKGADRTQKKTSFDSGKKKSDGDKPDKDSRRKVRHDLKKFFDKLEKVRKKHDQLNLGRKREDRKSPLPLQALSPEPNEAEDKNSHAYIVDKLEMAGDIALDTTLKRMAGEFAAQDINTRVARSGIVTPKAWKMNFGEIKVFTKPPFPLKRAVVIVDLSGSMGCWCEKCFEFDGYSEGKSKAWMALQVATAIGKAFPDTTDIFGFSSDDQHSYIYPLEIGREPICRRLYQTAIGTPLCVALRHLEEKYLSLDVTMAVLITDGDPGIPAPLSTEHMIDHTRKLSEELYIRGLRYCTVIIGGETLRELFPTEALVRVLSPSDFYKLQEVLLRITYCD